MRDLTQIRAGRPAEIAAAAKRRKLRPHPGPDERLMIIAADHPARGALGVRDRPLAMGNRRDLLDRLCTALARPGVDGVLGTPDILEDLLLMGALEEKMVIGSMNRGGLAGSAFELDDRFTGYDTDAIATMGFDGGKMLCRIDPSDRDTVSTLESCSRAISDLARARLMAMVEPFWSVRDAGRVRNDLSAEAIIRSISVAQALGVTSAYTWLKIPASAEMERVMEATTLPALLLGGDPPDVEAAYADWDRSLRLPGVRGLVIGRALLYPPGDDVAAAVDGAAALIRKEKA